MIVAVGGIKGGSGKTTIATNLTVLCAKRGRDVLLVDADEQESALDFTAQRNTQTQNTDYTAIHLVGTNVRLQTLRLAEKYDDIVIDVGGRDTTSQRAALSVCDVFLVPFAPRSFDVWTLAKVEALVTEMRQANPSFKAYTFINKADSRGQDNTEAAQILREEGRETTFIENISIGGRKSFGNASARGLGVVELKPADEKANEEIQALYDFVFSSQDKKKVVGAD